MKTNAKITIKEDTISEYFDYIYNTLHQTTEKELRKQARLLTGEFGDENDGYIAPNMTIGKFNREYNPNLFMSGQDEAYWEINDKSHSGSPSPIGGRNVSTIEMIYTGMRIEEYTSSDPPKVWAEFGDKAEGILERDYAFYQETGIDPIADSKDARATGAISLGTKLGSQELLNHSAKYLESIMKRGGGDIPPKLI